MGAAAPTPRIRRALGSNPQPFRIGGAIQARELMLIRPSALLETIEQETLRERMRSMRAFVAEFNLYRWAGRMLVNAARIRRRERFPGRLTDHVSTAIA
jgi:hypothetical protein